MKLSTITFLGLCASLCLLPAATFAQAPASAAAEKGDKGAGRVAVIDVGRILQSYGKFKDFESEIKSEQEQIQADLKTQKEKFNESLKVLNELKAGSPDYSKKEAEIAKLKTNIEVFQLSKERELLRRKHQFSKAVFDEMQEAVTKVADHYGYSLVIRHTRYEADSTDPRMVQMALSQPVVWSRKRDDITEAVLEVLNRRYEKSAGAVTPAGATRPAAGAKKPAVRPAAE